MDSILEAIFTYADKAPDRLCLVDDNREVTYAQCKTEALKTADALSKLGVGAGDYVVLEAKQSADYLIVEFAVWVLHAVFVPLEAHSPEGKIKSVAELTKAKLIVSDTDFSEGSGIKKVTYSDIKGTKEYSGFTLPKSSEVSEILFSTGTTGKEKGIVITHGNDVAVAENIAFAVSLSEDNVEMIPSPLNHSHGLRSFYADMLKGSTVVILSGMMNIMRFFECMDKYNVTAIDLVPTALSMLLKLSKKKIGNYKDRLRYIEFGSSKLDDNDKIKIKELLPEIPLYNFFGSTESGRCTVYNFNVNPEKPGCIGKPTINSNIAIVDDDGNEIKSDREHTGLMACGGPMNFTQYFNDPEETAEALKNGIVYFKDIAYKDADGDIMLLGRKGDVINSGGRKIAPEEIEDVAKTYPGVADAGCIGIDDKLLGSVPCLFITVKSGREVKSEEITEYIKDKLEAFKAPKEVIRIEEMPRTFNGKLIRRELREKYSSEFKK